MKARVKVTGEIIEISEECSYIFAEHYDKQYDLSELEFVQGPMRMEIFPDYWTHLEHQYAGMAMQGLIASNLDLLSHEIIEDAIEYAHALVEKLKEKEERK